jgi:polyhydroxyalkanoate synthesis regulator phasin
MPAPKRSSSASPRSSSAAKPAGRRTAAAAKSAATATKSAATATKSAATATKATATSTRKASPRTATQAKSGTAKTAKTGTARTKRASTGPDGIASVAEQLAKGAVKPRDLVMLTRDRIQETLDDAASRGRVTRKDANELVAELVRRGRSQSDDLLGELETVLGRGREQLESATKRARKAEPVDRLVRGADRVRRTAGVGPAFPILGYDKLTAPQVQSRIKELKKPELRKALTYERKHANRKSVVGALEKAIG